MNIQNDSLWKQVVFGEYYHPNVAFDKPLVETTVSSRVELNYYRDLCSNLKRDNRELIKKIDSLNKELEKKKQEYDELLEEVREC